MKEYTKEEWLLDKPKLIEEINSINERQFCFDNVKAKIKRKIPTNCSNKKEINEAVDGMSQGYNFFIVSSSYQGMTDSERNVIIRQKKEFIDIINSIELIYKSNSNLPLLKEQSTTKKETFWDYFHLKPNFLGLGLNLNYILNKIIFWRKNNRLKKTI